MPTRDDRRAAGILVGLAVAGLAVRLLLGAGAAPGAVAYRAAGGSRPPRDSVAARAARLSRPLGRYEKLDVDRVGAEELTRLPRIGPALASRIVSDRELRGPFGSLAALERVSGIGPTVLDAVRAHVTFSAGGPGVAGVEGRARVRLNRAGVEELATLPGIGPAKARAIVEDRRRRGPYRRLEDLARVPGIGPRTIARIRKCVLVP